MNFSKPRLPDDPRRAVRWVRDRLPDVQAGGRDVAQWIGGRLPQAVRPAPRRRMPETTALILPAVLAAAGAGAAFWWWTQWSRGRAEAQAAERAAEEGAARPQDIMDHSPPPPPAGDAPNPSDGRLAAPAEEIMAHAPPPAGATPKRKLNKLDPVIAPVAESALKHSLAVQASIEAPKPKRASKPPAKPTRPPA